ncbi:MAG: MFS transporter [Betaproteobacteria bacterium]|nr:MFS transporter [Betaproteobacteria bacterium]
MDKAKRNVAVLSACQALLLTNNSILIAITGLAGYALASNKVLATLPLTSYVVGAALTTLPMSLIMKRVGRRAGFTLGALIGIFGAGLCAYAVYLGSFWLLCLGMLVVGIYNAGGQYYRFAAADVASAEFKSTAISLVLAGGIAGGVLGPESSKFTMNLFAQFAFMGPYLSLTVFCVIAILLLRLVDIPPLSEAERREPGRPLADIARQPAFVVAVAAATVSYGVMNLLMTATPLAMVAHEHPFRDAAFVIQWHVIGMFAPSFFTGSLIKRFGALTVMLAGVVLELACIAIALTGVHVISFWLAMVLLGVGWNFMFVGATSLLTECHTPAERAKTQGVNDFAIFFTMAISSASSGALFTSQGWQVMNIGAVPFLLAVGAAIAWLAAVRRAGHTAV